MKTSRTRKALIISFMMILVCLISFTMTTFAWFSDSVSSSNNIITVGNLDAEMYWTDNLKTDNWYNIEDSRYNAVFTHDNYEPGYTDVKYIKIVNKGTLSFKYDLKLLALGTVGELADVVDIYTLPNATSNISSRKLSEMNKLGTIRENIGNTLSGVGSLLSNGEVVVAIALQMQKDAGNEYQGKSIGDGFSIQLVATQYNNESDSFGSDYDKNATFPVTISTGISTQNGVVTEEAKMKAGLVEATIPAGVKVNEGKNILTLSVTEMEETGSNITVTEDEVATSLDVHIEGVSSDNKVPMLITVNSVAGKYLNDGNLDLYHVEDGVTNKMEQVDSLSELDKHNEFYYDAQSGAVVLALASFSEVRAVQKKVNAWQGGVDHSWYTNKTSDQEYYTIYNGDQLNSFAQIVGGMAEGIALDDFSGETVKLLADIDLGDLVDENGKVFYPIGYYNNLKSFTKQSGKFTIDGKENTALYSSVSSFEGTFDGNGHTISNFYQNTWEMFGDYNDGYGGTPNHYKDGMGLFGYVYNGTIKNLRIENFSSDGEFTPTGVVAAYACNATFENIAVVNCNPRVYNTGNGGIVGIAGNSDDETDKTILFKNITVDNTNKISALWGSWDVACGGIAGMYRGDSKIKFVNCHVAAQIDVNNDVCANYQYYAYRYSGMLIGSVRQNVTINGHSYPKLTNVYAESTTVHFGEWNNYYYCELVANSLASYTHDHQFSRLTEVDNVDVANMKVTINGVVQDIPTSGRYNYVVISGGHDTDHATCYHFVNGEQWTHDKAGKETVSGQEVLKEDKQHIYLPFNQLFTGYGWGVTSKSVNDVNEDPTLNGQVTAGQIQVSILDKLDGASIVKFNPVNTYVEYQAGATLKLGDLFTAANNATDISGIHTESISVAITYVDENGNAKSVEADININASDWKQSTITLPSDVAGEGYITIQDYVYCQPTTVVLHVHNFNNMQYDDENHWTGCSCSENVIKTAHSFVEVEKIGDYTMYKCSGCDYAHTVRNSYPVTVNHLNIDGSVASAQETKSSSEVIKAKEITDKVPSLKEVKVDVARGQDVVNIYYSEVKVWDGVTKTDVLTGSGKTEDDPFIISSGADLQCLQNWIASQGVGDHCTGLYYKLVNSIDMNGHSLQLGDYPGWYSRIAFNGTFDGNNCSIINIAIDKDTHSAGLFGAIGENGVVKNLTVDGKVNSTYTVGSYAAGIVAYNSGLVQNCTNYVTVTANSYFVGGVVGYNEQYKGKIYDCTNYGSVSSSSTGIGGIAGCNKYEVVNCVNYGTVNGRNIVGGIVGSLEYGKVNNQVTGTQGFVDDCINYGTIIGTDNNIGGIVGQSVGTISDSTNFGYVKGIYNVGGILGHSNDSTNENGIIVENCENYGFLESGYELGGIVGKTYFTINLCTNYGTLKGSGTHIGGIAGALTKLANSKAPQVIDCNNNGDIIGGSWGIAGIVAYSEGSVITDCTNNGNISNVKGQVGGIIGKSNGDTITRCYNNGDINATESSVGGIVGDHYDSAEPDVLLDIVIISCENTGDINGKSYVGGIIGRFFQGSVTSSVNKGNVTGTGIYIGGIAGYLAGSLADCENNGIIVTTQSGTTYIGGIYGINTKTGNVDNCSNNNHVYISSDYTKGNNFHFNNCIDAQHCNNVLNHSKHTFNGTTCTVCGYSYSQVVNIVVDGKVYFKPNSDWKNDKAWFAAVFTNSSWSQSKWVAMSDANGDGIYECTLPTDSYITHVQFQRMNSASQSMTWNNKWNSSATIKLSTTGNLLTLSNGAGDGINGTWSTHKESHSVDLKMYSYIEDYAPNKVYLKPNNDWKSNGARFAVWAWSGSTSGTWFDMTDADKDGIFEVILPEQYDMVIFYRMDPSKPNNNSDHTDQGGSMWNKTGDILLNDRTSNLFVIDSWSGGYWQSVVEETASYRLQQGSSENTLELELYLESDTYYSFKLNEGSTWYGNTGLIESETENSWKMTEKNPYHDAIAPNCRFVAEETGYYKFVYNYGTQELSVEFIGTSYSN